MSHKNRIVNFLMAAIIAAYENNRRFIESLPSEEVDGLGVRRYPTTADISNEDRAELREIANNVMNQFYDYIQSDVIIDCNGHNRTSTISLTEFNNGYDNPKWSPYSKRKVVNYNNFGLMMAIANLPSTTKNEFDLDQYLIDSLVVNSDHCMTFGEASEECFVCGGNFYSELDINTLTIRPRKDLNSSACKFPNGIGLHTIELKVQSGKLVVANDLRRVLPNDITKENDRYIHTTSGGAVYGINSEYGRKLNSDYWALYGLMYFQCGNTCPSYFRTKDNKSIIFKDDYVYDDEDNETSNFSDDEEKLGYVCTDLWAVNAMDYATFEQYCKLQKTTPDHMIDECDAEIIDIIPGVYNCTGYYEDPELDKTHFTYATMQLKEHENERT